MSNTDSFIDEVTEEVQRDRLFGYVRKYGWIAVVLVVALVGGTAWNEIRKASERNAAQSLGDGIFAVLENGDPASQPAALQALDAGEEASPALKLLQGALSLAAEQPTEAVAALESVASDESVSKVYRDLAALRLVQMGAEHVPAALRREFLDQVVIPGGPFRLLGLEQEVLLLVEAGDKEAAISSAEALLQEAGVTSGLQQRMSQLIVALGGGREAGAQTADQ